ncbi:DgyrCDS7729 [Dimorphilus gyrociliatus]|uniref:hypoxia-inducible factor-proline dioxygenase n=1 Tax=Dimorphilus gyrociliatus TaxID=2664684 RepID=A0A7I8VTP2_9ANNE|nr:DgyrCDS7729 [Dimorphilus gyrociliatus]
MYRTEKKVSKCEVCDTIDNLLVCGACRLSYYCGRDHQKSDWDNHQQICKQRTEQSWSDLNFENVLKDTSLNKHCEKSSKLTEYIVECMNKYGICVLDNFFCEPRAGDILNEVKSLRSQGAFTDGQLVSQPATTGKVRGDQILWLEKNDKHPYITSFIERLDSIVMDCAKKLKQYQIGGRTKAMIACYPGNGTGYMRHIDNPNEDGRCLTTIYYLNKNWNTQTDGGLLRIFPEVFNQVADIEPKFDRLLFFWSDRRMPHEVLPTYKERYAITVWYFDTEERARAIRRVQNTT